MKVRTVVVAVVVVLIAEAGFGVPAARADSAPTMSISDVTQVEGNSGTVNDVFTVKLGYAATTEVDVNYATADSTAVAPGDYTPVHGTLVFAPGVTSKTITVLVNGDSIHEANESFTVNLASAVNASVSDSAGTGVITD